MTMQATPLPPNTYDMVMRFRVTLPRGETPAEQDPTLVITGECYDPWPGVQIHDAELLGWEPSPSCPEAAGPLASLEEVVMGADVESLSEVEA